MNNKSEIDPRLLETASHSPMRARRRQSDAKWRASVATCYDALRQVVPETKRLSKKKISKALILEESEKHIQDLETTIDHLIKVKCPSDGRAMLWKENHYWTRCSVDNFRGDFANQQEKIFHRSYQSRRCYSLFRDIQEEVFNMAPDPGNICFIDEKLLPPAQDTEASSGSPVTVLQTRVFLHDPSSEKGNEGLDHHVAATEEDASQSQIVPSISAPSSSGKDREKGSSSFTVLDIVPTTSSTPYYTVPPSLSSIGISIDTPGKEQPQTVPSLLSPFPEESVPISFWSSHEDEEKEGDHVPNTDTCVKIESVSPVIHIPLLDDQNIVVARNLAEDKIPKQEISTLEDLEVYGNLTGRTDPGLCDTENNAGIERTPAVHPKRETGDPVLTEGFKRKGPLRYQDEEVRSTPKCRKRLYGSLHAATYPGNDSIGMWCANNHDDSQVVPQAEVTNTFTNNTRKADAVDTIDIESLLPSDLTFCREAQADYNGFSYYYRQVSQKLCKNQNLSTTEVAAKIAHMWTRMSDQDKQTIKILASIENQEWRANPHSSQLGDLSQDLQDVDVEPLEIQEWTESAK